jgi:hypothetical protein
MVEIGPREERCAGEKALMRKETGTREKPGCGKEPGCSLNPIRGPDCEALRARGGREQHTHKACQGQHSQNYARGRTLHTRPRTSAHCPHDGSARCFIPHRAPRSRRGTLGIWTVLRAMPSKRTSRSPESRSAIRRRNRLFPDPEAPRMTMHLPTAIAKSKGPAGRLRRATVRSRGPLIAPAFCGSIRTYRRRAMTRGRSVPGHPSATCKCQRSHGRYRPSVRGRICRP